MNPNRPRVIIAGVFVICAFTSALALYKDVSPPLTWPLLLCGLWSAGVWLWPEQIALKRLLNKCILLFKELGISLLIIAILILFGSVVDQWLQGYIAKRNQTPEARYAQILENYFPATPKAAQQPTPQEILRRALLEDKFPESDPTLAEERLFKPTGEDALKLERNIALSAWMTKAAGRDINAGSITWQADKDALAQGYFQLKDASNVSDERLHTLVRSHIQTAEEASKLAIDSALSGRPLPEVMLELNSLTGTSMTRNIRDQYIQQALQIYNAATARRVKYAQTIDPAAKLLQGEGDKNYPGPTTFKGIASAILDKVPGVDQQFVTEAIVATAAKTLDERCTYLSKLGATLKQLRQ
jgi:hypothetical protein